MPTTRKGQPGPGGPSSATKTRTPGKHRSAAGSSTTAKTPGTNSSSCSSCSGAATKADREARLDKLEVRVKHIQLQVEEARKLEALETKFRAQGLLRRLDDLEANFSELETRCSETVVRRCELTEATVDALRVDASASLTAFRERVNEVLKSLQESFKARFAQTRDRNAAQLERALAHAGSLEHEIGVLDESLRAARAETHELARRLRTSEALVHELQQEQRRQSGQIQSLLGLVNRMQQQNYQHQQQSPRWESQGQDQQRVRSFIMR